MSFIEIGSFKYTRSLCSNYLEDVIEEDDIETEYYNFTEEEIQALCISDNLINRNKYVSFRLFQLVDAAEISKKDEFQLIKWIYIEYYMKNRSFVVDNLETYTTKLLENKLKQFRKNTFIFKKWYLKLKGEYSIVINNLNSGIINCHEVLKKIKKEKEEINNILKYVTATICLKNTSLFNQLEILKI